MSRNRVDDAAVPVGSGFDDQVDGGQSSANQHNGLVRFQTVNCTG